MLIGAIVMSNQQRVLMSSMMEFTIDVKSRVVSPKITTLPLLKMLTHNGLYLLNRSAGNSSGSNIASWPNFTKFN